MKKILSVLSLLLVAAATNAQQVQANTELQGIIRKGFVYFPKMKELEQVTRINEDKIGVMKSYLYPSVNGSASYNYLNPVGQASFPIGPSQTQTIQFQPYDNWNAGVSLNYVVLDFGRVGANIRKAKADLQLGQQNVSLLQNQLAAQISSVYYGLIYLKKAVTIQDSVIAFLEENKQLVESKFRHGDALKLDVLNIQAQIDIEENRKAELQSQLEKQLNLMAYAIGERYMPEGAEFDFNIKNTVGVNGLELAEEQHPEFKLAATRIQSAKADVQLARAQNMPLLSVLGSTGYRNGYQPAIQDLRFNYGAGAALSVPIFNGTRMYKQVNMARNAQHLNELAVVTLEDQFKKDIGQAVVEVKTNEDRLQYVQSQIDQTMMARTLAESRFRNGAGTNLELTTASTNVQRAYFTRLQYQYQLCLAQVELARLTGLLYY